MSRLAIPLYDRIIVRRDESQGQSAGGIIIPEGFKEKPQQGTVIAVGSGRLHTDGNVTKLDVQIGDVVLFGKYSGIEVTVNDEQVVILREEEVLVKLVESTQVAHA